MVFVALTVAGVVIFLTGEKRGSNAARWLGKPLASGAFLATAWSRGALDTPFGRWVAVALVFCFAGDVLLIQRSTFVFGLAAFLVGHLLFAVAFLARGVAVSATAVAAVVAVAAAVGVVRWLWPHLPTRMRAPVIGYIVAISAMLALAVGTYVFSATPLLLGGAIAFYLSDLSVARNRFVKPGFENRLWGIPLYYAGQLLIAWSVT